MARPANTTLLRIGGALAGGERWSCGLWFVGTQSGGSLQTRLNAIPATSTDPITLAFGNYLATGDSINRLDAYYYGSGGNVATEQASRALSLAGAGVRTMPDQVCIVNSVRSAVSGRRSRGRVYVPVGQVPSADNNGGQLTTAAAQTQANRMAAFINSVQQYMGDSCVVSTVGGFTSLVSSIEVDTRFDIQRRRAAQQAIGARASAAVT